MQVQPRSSRLEVKEAGEVTVVRFTDRRILGEGPCQTAGEQLFSLVDDRGCRHLVLNFSGVERLDSAFVAKLVWLHQKVRAAGGRLALCDLNPTLSEIFRTLRLHRLLHLYGEEQEALQSFR